MIRVASGDIYQDGLALDMVATAQKAQAIMYATVTASQHGPDHHWPGT